jgi:hypothetical protein
MLAILCFSALSILFSVNVALCKTLVKSNQKIRALEAKVQKCEDKVLGIKLALRVLGKNVLESKD